MSRRRIVAVSALAVIAIAATAVVEMPTRLALRTGKGSAGGTYRYYT